MSIRLLALELYRAKQKVDGVQRQMQKLQQDSADGQKHNLQRELDEALKEYNMIKKMFEARKNAANTSFISDRYYRGMK